MLILTANHSSWVLHHYGTRLPGSLGHLWSPGRTIDCYPHLMYACDNGRFACWNNNREWDEAEFIEFCEHLKYLPRQPLFLTVPDVVCNAETTLEEWALWEPKLRKYGVPLAFVVQNGIEPDQIPSSADWIFVGGSDEWKFTRIPEFLSLGKPVHVGRVNGQKIWTLDRLGIDSCDGTGWFKGGDGRAVLETYLRAQLGEVEVPARWSSAQLDLFQEESRTLYFNSWQHIPRRPNYWNQAIPRAIERQHILQAIAHWDEVPQKHWGKYGVLHEGKAYPPKLLVARAAYWAVGTYWNTQLFSGGRDLHRFLKSKGFEVVQLGQLEAPQIKAS